jgi:hypothetical protein
MSLHGFSTDTRVHGLWPVRAHRVLHRSLGSVHAASAALCTSEVSMQPALAGDSHVSAAVIIND